MSLTKKSIMGSVESPTVEPIVPPMLVVPLSRNMVVLMAIALSFAQFWLY